MKELIGETVKIIDSTKHEILFTCESGKKFIMYHSQDCCEYVSIENISGDLSDLIGSPIIKAEERTSNEYQKGQETSDYDDESFTWTFYTLATMKGYVDIRWYGESNGYYSESVNFELVNNDDFCQRDCELLK